MKFVVSICSVRRPEVIHETVLSILRQDLMPDRILLCVASKTDYKEETIDLDARVEVVLAPVPGLTSQRNFAIDCLVSSSPEVTVFLDDDVELEPAFFSKMLALFERNDELIGLSAETIVDGVMVDRSRAQEAIRNLDAPPIAELSVRTSGKHWICHGCNMFFRTRLFEKERFDEALPLYSYAEDYDFSIRAARHGQVGRVGGIGFAHLTYSGGRVSEKRRGYSMIANNYYFLKKRVLHLPLLEAYARFWIIIVVKETALSICHAMRGREAEHVDYWGRSYGRIAAVTDILLGKSSPQEILNAKRFR